MGEGDYGYSCGGYSCDSCVSKRDCDGDYNNYCYYSGSCAYKRAVRDCDGDIVYMCDK